MAKREKERKHRINEYIKSDEVRIVGGIEEVENGIYSLREALTLAYRYNVDLVEKSNSNGTPICELIEYNRFLYKLKKKEKEQKAKQVTNEVKELRFSPHTDDHDIEFKLKHAINFLGKNMKVRAYVEFRGREIQHKELGETLLLKFAEKLLEHGIAENLPKLEGRIMSMMFKPKKI